MRGIASTGDEETELLMPSSSCRSKLPRPSATTITYLGVCGLLAVQNSSYTLLRRFGHGVLKQEASSQSILAVGEMMKAAFCMYMVLRGRSVRGKDLDPDDEEVAEERPHGIWSAARRLAATSFPMAVPALICVCACPSTLASRQSCDSLATALRRPCNGLATALRRPCTSDDPDRNRPVDSLLTGHVLPIPTVLAMNLLSFVALKRISASAFTLIQQSKIIATAVLSRVVLQKQISGSRWRSLGTLLFAVLIICYETRPQQQPSCSDGTSTTSTKESQGAAQVAEYAVGVGAVTLEAILSGFSNVYFERVLKSTSLTLWERNVQLAGYSLLIYVPMAVMEHGYLLHGWTSLTWIIAFLGALGGILIGLVISYMDSISKNLALSAAIVLTACLDHAWFDGPMTLNIVAAAGIVIISIATYSSA